MKTAATAAATTASPSVVAGATPTTTKHDRYRLSKPVHYDLFEPDQYDLNGSYNWSAYLDKQEGEFTPIPVDKFRYAPLQSIFHHLRPGLKVEVPNKDYEHLKSSIGGVYWVAFVVKVAGYKALMRYEGFAQDGSHDFWMNLCCADVHPVGWCANEGKPLVPPKSLQEKEQDWKSFLVKRLTGSRTLPADWHKRVQSAILASKFKVGQRLELIDRIQSTRIRPAIIKRIVGRRLKVLLSEEDMPADTDSADGESQQLNGDWVDQGSPFIFPVGWAVRCNYGLYANDAYKQHCVRIVNTDPEGRGTGDAYADNDTRPDQFQITPSIERPTAASSDNNEDDAAARIEKSLTAPGLMDWQRGMKLECLDPLTDMLNSLTVATVIDILPCGYLKIGFDGPDMEDESLPLHRNSSQLFPIGYAETNKIELRPPKGSDERAKFDWQKYLKQTNSVGAPGELFDHDNYEDMNAFEVNGKLEAIDMVEPNLACVATIRERKGRLLLVHFDGWESQYDQLFDFRSPDLMPLGWAEMVGHKLEAPKQAAPPTIKRPKAPASVGSAKKQKKE
uniref:Uncharacterized protein n=1 Tax=Plectus sambesii TaxID=2011161 RepID=A0A914VV60_9BILA